MKEKSKKCLSVIAIFISVVMVFVCLPDNVAEAKPSGTIVYELWGDSTSTFVRKSGKLTVKTSYPMKTYKFKDGELGENLDRNPKKISYRLAKNCKWNQYYVGDKDPSSEITYKDLRKRINDEYKTAQKYGEYDSPTRIWILVRNNRIIEVMAINS